MPDVQTPAPPGTKIGPVLGGYVHGPALIHDETGADAMGRVIDAPDPLTMLGRLKAIADGVTSLSGHVDGLEGAAASLNGFVDGIEALLGTANANLTAIGGYMDGLEALATLLNGYVDGLEGLLTTLNTRLGNQLPAAWADPLAAFDARLWTDVEVQFVGTVTTPYTPQRSLDGTNYVAAVAYDRDGNAVTSITTAGIYALDGGGYVKFGGGAGASAVTLRAGA